jgi:hypothetical protein
MNNLKICIHYSKYHINDFTHSSKKKSLKSSTKAPNPSTLPDPQTLN